MDINSLHKEIDLIQSCINRMAENSFKIKGWLIALVSVILALSGKSVNTITLCLIVLIPVSAFWYLDALFLRVERMYREMYSWVLENRQADNMEHQYDLNPLRFENKVDSVVDIMLSKTLKIFYAIPLTVTMCVILFQLIK